MSHIEKLFKHSSHYFAGQFVLLLTGLVSFPILTRAFTVSEYGTLSLITSVLLFSTALGKLGLQHAAVRFYDEFKSGKRREPISRFYSTIFLGPLMCSVLIILVVLIVRGLISNSRSGSIFAGLMALLAVLIPLQCAHSTFIELLRAEQRTRFYNVFTIVLRMSQVLLSLLCVLVFFKDLYGFFLGQTIAGLMALLFIVVMLWKNRLISPGQFSFAFLKEAVKYGFPLLALEFAIDLLTNGDRFLIEHYLGRHELGMYSVGYSLAMYVYSLMVVPLRLAIFPIYTNIWVNQGEQKTKEFLSKSLRYFLLFAIPVVVGFSAVAKELTAFLASSKYSRSYVIVPYIITGLMIYGTHNICAAGLHIYRRTLVLAGATSLACIVDLVVNMLLIPRLGIVGAGIASLLAFSTSFCVVFAFSFKLLPFKIEYGRICSYIAFASVMFLAVKNISFQNQVLNLAGKIGLGFLIYAGLVVSFDSQIKAALVGLLRRHASARVSSQGVVTDRS